MPERGTIGAQSVFGHNRMTPTIAHLSRRCLAMTGDWPAFEDARDALYEAIVQEIERGCQEDGRDVSQVIFYDPSVYRVRLIRSPLDSDVEARIAKGEAFLRQETAKALVDRQDRALDHAAHIVAVLDRLGALHAWISRPASMFEITVDPTRVKHVHVQHPNQLAIKKTA